MLNTYWPLGSVETTPGDYSIPTLPSGTSSRGASETLSPGDVVMIHQTQGVDIDPTEGNNYGDGSAGPNIGRGHLNTVS